MGRLQHRPVFIIGSCGRPVGLESKVKLIDRIANKPLPMIADGAIGTRLLSDRKAPVARDRQLPCVELLNLTSPDLVSAVHRSYLAAGAEILVTNSFCATSGHLARHGLAAKVDRINREAADLARSAISAIKPSISFVLGSSGPLATSTGAREQYAEQLRGLAAGGVDAFLFESVRSLAQLEAALSAAAEFPLIPVLTSLCPIDNSLGLTDGSLLDFVDLSVSRAVLALGINCGDGNQLVYQALAAVRKHYMGPLMAMPSAGVPKMHEGRLSYPLAPEVWSGNFLAWHREFNLAIAGGCCGTTPLHIRALEQLR
jgi:methionine synthase I (cobalamin-dependent)